MRCDLVSDGFVYKLNQFCVAVFFETVVGGKLFVGGQFESQNEVFGVQNATDRLGNGFQQFVSRHRIVPVMCFARGRALVWGSLGPTNRGKVRQWG